MLPSGVARVSQMEYNESVCVFFFKDFINNSNITIQITVGFKAKNQGRKRKENGGENGLGDVGSKELEINNNFRPDITLNPYLTVSLA